MSSILQEDGSYILLEDGSLLLTEEDAVTGTGTWDPVGKSYEWTLSNNNLTVTHSQGQNAAAGIYGTDGITTGDHTYSVTLDVVSWSFQIGVSNKAIAITSSRGWSDHDIIVDKNGDIRKKSTAYGNVGTLNTGDTLDIRVKNQRFYARRNGGAWVPTDPSANGGVDCSTITNQPLYPILFSQSTTTSVTGDFTQWNAYAATDVAATTLTSAFALVGFEPQTQATVVPVGSTNWTPAELANTQLWLDVSDNATLGFTNYPLIDRVTDKSTSARTVTSTAMPDHTPGAINGLAAANFSNDRLEFTDIPAGTSLSAFFAFQSATPQTLSIMLGSNNSLMMPIGASNSATNTEVFRGTTVPTIRKNGAVEVWNNRGTAHTSLTDSQAQVLGFVDFTLSDKLMYVGAGPFSYFFKGLMGEVIITPSGLSTADVERIEGYLAWKWGTQARLPVDHTYRNAAPTVATTGPAVVNATAALQPGSTTLQTFAPSSVASRNATANTALGSVSLTGRAPQTASSRNFTASPTSSALSLAGHQAATLATQSTSTLIGASNLDIQGHAVTATSSIAAVAGKQTIELQGYIPDLVSRTNATAVLAGGQLSLVATPLQISAGVQASAQTSGIVLTSGVPQASNHQSLTFALGSLQVVGRQTTLSSGAQGSALKGTVTLLGRIPLVSSQSVTGAQAGSMAIQGRMPTSLVSTSTQTGTGALVVTGLVSTMSSATAAETLASNISLSGQPVTLTSGTTAPVASGGLTLQMFAPYVGMTSSGDVLVGRSDLLLSGRAPSVQVNQSTTTSTDGLQITGRAPARSVSYTRVPAAGSLVVGGLEVQASSGHGASTLTSGLNVVGQTPTVRSAVASQSTTSGLVIQGRAPTASVTASSAIGRSVLQLAAGASTVSVGASTQLGRTTITMQGYRPTPTVDVVSKPARGTLELTGYNVLLSTRLDQEAELGSHALQLLGRLPGVRIDNLLQVGKSSLILAGKSPTSAAGSVAQVSARAVAIQAGAISTVVSVAATLQRSHLIITGYQTVNSDDDVAVTGLGGLSLESHKPRVAVSHNPQLPNVELSLVSPIMETSSSVTVSPLPTSFKLLSSPPFPAADSRARPAVQSLNLQGFEPQASVGQAAEIESQHLTLVASDAEIFSGIVADIGVGHVSLTPGRLYSGTYKPKRVVIFS